MLPSDPDAILLLHNPRCSKSRAAKALLTARRVAHEERRYLEAPLSLAELDELARRLGRPLLDLVRTQEPAYRSAGLGPLASEAQLLAALAEHPELLERPVLVRGPRARIGRPPEAILELLE